MSTVKGVGHEDVASKTPRAPRRFFEGKGNFHHFIGTGRFSYMRFCWFLMVDVGKKSHHHWVKQSQHVSITSIQNPPFQRFRRMAGVRLWPVFLPSIFYILLDTTQRLPQFLFCQAATFLTLILVCLEAGSHRKFYSIHLWLGRFLYPLTIDKYMKFLVQLCTANSRKNMFPSQLNQMTIFPRCETACLPSLKFLLRLAKCEVLEQLCRHCFKARFCLLSAKGSTTSWCASLWRSAKKYPIQSQYNAKTPKHV